MILKKIKDFGFGFIEIQLNKNFLFEHRFIIKGGNPTDQAYIWKKVTEQDADYKKYYPIYKKLKSERNDK